MNILLISTRMGTAGVETLILRMAKWLHEAGHTVDVLLMREVDKIAADLLRQYARVYIGWHFFSLHRQLKQAGKQYYDCLYTFSLFPLLYTLLIKQVYFSDTPVCFGVYHPLEFCGLGEKTALGRLAADLMTKVPPQTIFFMNDAVKDRHSERLHYDFSCSPIIPIPIDLQRFGLIQRQYKRQEPYKIVSIGRITCFKTYNFNMLEVMQELARRGVNATYHIYGDGEQFDELKQSIAQHNLQDKVFLHGAIAYQHFADVLTDAFLFIGMGTAIVEAACCYVPCLQAIENDTKSMSYGFFHQLTGFNVGEKNIAQPEYPIVDDIMALIALDEKQYLSIEKLSYQRAKEFDIDTIMARFLSHCKKAPNIGYLLKKSVIFTTLASAIFWFICKKMRFKTPFDSRYSN